MAAAPAAPVLSLAMSAEDFNTFLLNAFGYGNNGKNNHEMVNGSSGDPNAPSTPTTKRRSARVKSSDWNVARLP